MDEPMERHEEVQRYRTQRDVETLMEAFRIRKDKKRMARALKMAREQQKALTEIA